MNKTFLVNLFLLLAVSVFGAVPDYKAFRGAGGIMIQSNPPTGTIVIDGTGVVATGTNSSIRTSVNGTNVTAGATNLNLVAGTNIVLSGTNIGSDTHIGIALAPNVYIPGTFTSRGTAEFIDGVDFDNSVAFHSTVFITNGAVNGYVFTTDGTGSGTWQPNASPTKIGIGNTLYLDSSFGNDSTASRTNLLRPFITASNAIASISNYDTLIVRAGTYLINPKSDLEHQSTTNGSYGANTSGGVAITNRSNFRIAGEPGAVFQMSARNYQGLTSSCPMLVISRCTNFIIEDLSLVGVRTTTNGKVFEDFAILLDNCDTVVLRRLKIREWENQGITIDMLNGGVPGVRNMRVEYCDFVNVGGTNQIVAGGDGCSLGINGTNIFVSGCTFTNCYRPMESYGGLVGNGACYRATIRDNLFDKPYGSCFIFQATVNNEIQIVNNKAFGYSTNLPQGITEANFISTYGMSNVLISHNMIGGMSGVIREANDGFYPLTDVQIWDNEFYDVQYRGVLALQDVAHAGVISRLSIKNNKFRNMLKTAVNINGNDNVVQGNQFYDCDTTVDKLGVLAIGIYSANGATNSTNNVISDNVVMASDIAGYANAFAIMNYGTCYSNLFFNNYVDPRMYVTNFHDVGVGTRTRPVNLVAASKVLATDAYGFETGLTVGPNLVNTGGILSVNTNPVFNTVTANNFGSSILLLISNACASVVTVSRGNTNITITTNAVSGHTDYVVSSTASGGSGTPAGSNFEVQYNNAGAFGASDQFRYLPSGYQLQFKNTPAGTEVDIDGVGFISQANGGYGLAFGLGGKTNILIDVHGNTIIRNKPGLGTNLFQVEFTNQLSAVLVNSNGGFEIAGSGTGAAHALYNAAGTNIQFEPSPSMASNLVVRYPTNGVHGPMVMDGESNQMFQVALTAGQYLTYNGTAYVASNLPSASAGTNAFGTVRGAGTDFSLPTTTAARVDFGTTDPEVSLPSAGTYYVDYDMLVSSTQAGDTIWSYLYNSTGASVVSGTNYIINSIANYVYTAHGSAYVTVSGASTIQIYSYNVTAARGLAYSAYTEIKYHKLF